MKRFLTVKVLPSVLALTLLAAPAAPYTFVESNHYVAMEAEHYTTQNGYVEGTPSGASGNKYMQVGTSGRLNFEFTVSSDADRWYVWIRSQAHDSEMNGVYLLIDNVHNTAPSDNTYSGARDIYLKKSNTTWYWTPEYQGPGSGEHEGPIVIDNLAPGKHTLTLEKRKSERPFIDKIVLTQVNVAPSGFGTPETAAGTPVNANEEVKSGVRIHVRPNPFNQMAVVQYAPVGANGNIRMTVLDVKGRTVTGQTFRADQLRQGIAWNARDRAPGFYVIRLQCGRETVTRKVFLMK
jgi:hypothetical protein